MTITLSNGVRVANFSSPHSFNFEDGNILPACDPERVKVGSLEKSEEENPFPGLEDVVTAVIPKFLLTQVIRDSLHELHTDAGVDVVLIPFPVLNCLRESGELAHFYKCATISVKDRQTKEIFIDRFCR